MSNAPSARAPVEPAEFDAARRAESTAPVAVGAVRANDFECAAGVSYLHHHLRAQLREARLHITADTPELRNLLRLVSAHYEAVDEERRGIVQSMRLMAEEARATAR